MKKWLCIRDHSFAKNVMERYKQESKKGTQKSKPLRSKLFTDDDMYPLNKYSILRSKKNKVINVMIYFRVRIIKS